MKKRIFFGITFLITCGFVFANNYDIEQNPYSIPRIYGSSWCQLRGPTVSARFFIGAPNPGDTYACQIQASIKDANNNVTSCQTIDNQIVTIPNTGRSIWMSYIASDMQNCLTSLNSTDIFDVMILCTNQIDQSIIRSRLPSAYCTE